LWRKDEAHDEKGGESSGVIAGSRPQKDFLPAIRIPAVAAAFQYTGMSPEDMSGRIITP
jgi:multidrug efflux pump subunit AcrB